jgi:predicted Zn-dependent protease
VNRLAYLFGTASARTYPQGLISFDRSFFLVQGYNNDALRCVVAHELTHFLHRHAYLSSRREQQSDLRGLSEPQQARDLAQLSQQQELAADRGALLMTSIAGHDPDACIRQLQEAAELDGDYSPDDPGGTHPGHGRRIAAARAYLRQGLQGDLAAWRKLPAGRPVVPRWSWDGADRLLTATTRP